jgi:hypothetical protein
MLHPIFDTPAAMYSAVLYCTTIVLYCTERYCTERYCIVLYCTVLYCTVLYCSCTCYLPSGETTAKYLVMALSTAFMRSSLRTVTEKRRGGDESERRDDAA